MNDPKVSVCIFTYNFAGYIAQALESVLKQRTSFDFEIVVGDDCSTDTTRDIVLGFKNRYPDKIVLSFNKVNLGGTRNWIQSINSCKGKYISLLDGDDYFIDDNKLQKQYDILENDQAANLTFHSVKEIFEDKEGKEQDVIFAGSEYYITDILRKGWFMRTSSLFFRNGILPASPPEWVYQFPYRYDTILITMLCIHAKAINYKAVMTVWRRHSAGLSYSITKDYFQHYKIESALYIQLLRLTGIEYKGAVAKYLRHIRTAVVLMSLKSLTLGNLVKLGFLKTINIDYSYFFTLLFKSIKNRFSPR